LAKLKFQGEKIINFDVRVYDYCRCYSSNIKYRLKFITEILNYRGSCPYLRFFSAPFVPNAANALKNKKIILSGITIGIIGYSVGSFIGISPAFQLK